MSFGRVLPPPQIKRSSIRKGMVMVAPKLLPQATWEFEAEILVLHHPTTISPRYQAMGEFLPAPSLRRPPPLLTPSPPLQSTAAASGRRPPS